MPKITIELKSLPQVKVKRLYMWFVDRERVYSYLLTDNQTFSNQAELEQHHQIVKQNIKELEAYLNEN